MEVCVYAFVCRRVVFVRMVRLAARKRRVFYVLEVSLNSELEICLCGNDMVVQMDILNGGGHDFP